MTTTTVRRALARHSTGLTIVLVGVYSVVLSALPLPDALRPLDFMREDNPLKGAFGVLFAHAGGGGARGGAQDVADVADTNLEAEEPQKAEVVPVSAAGRAKWAPPPREKYDDMRRLVAANPLPVVNPCVEVKKDGSCERLALDRFFARLRQAEDGTEGPPVRVVHFGDSLIASDHITDLVRQRLHERFGSAGRGMLLVDRLSRFAGRRVRTGVASQNWTLDVITMEKPRDKFFGYTGASFTSSQDGESTVFDVGPNKAAEIFFLAHKDGGSMDVLADDKKLTTIDTKSAEPKSSVGEVKLPAGTKSLKIVAKRGVRIFGVSLEAGVPGVIYESLGLPGATSKVWMFPDEDSFGVQLKHRDPALVVTMLGGNDGLMLSKKRATIEEIETNTRGFIRRLHKVVPGADCLMVSPMDAARVTVGGPMQSKPEVREVLAVQKRIADEEGCAFWDMWASMGGTGALERWWNAKMINPDMIHPMGYGGDLLGELMVTALMQAYDEWHSGGAPVLFVADPVMLTVNLSDEPAPKEDARSPEPAPSASAEALARPREEPRPQRYGALEDPTGSALEPFFAKLRALEQSKQGRAEVAIFGSTHIAGRRLSDELAGRLGRRFGDRGRGWVSAGRAAKVIADAGADRALRGAFDIKDGKDSTRTPRIGMSGVRTELRRTGRFTYSPCTDCEAVPSIFSLFYWSQPGMAAAKVEVQDLGFEVIGRGRVPTGLEVKRWVTKSKKPRISVEAIGVGSLDLFGLSHEYDRPGVVVDSIALAGVTPEVVLHWDQDLTMTMLGKLDPGLLVLAYGEIEGQADDLDESGYKRDFARLLQRLRTAAEDAPCLVLGPPPSLTGETMPRQFRAIPKIDRIQRAVAEQEGCAYWSSVNAIGGERAALRWLAEAPGRFTPDGRLFADEGLRILAGLLIADLMQEYDASAAKRGASARAAN